MATIDREQIPADLAVCKVVVPAARDVVLPVTRDGLDVDAVDCPQTAGVEERFDNADGRANAALEADYRATVVGLGEGGEFLCVAEVGGERPFDVDSLAGGEGGEGKAVVGIDTRRDDEEVDVRVGGEVGGGGVGFGAGGEVVGFDGGVGRVKARVAKGDDGVIWGCEESREVSECCPGVGFAGEADDADADWCHGCLTEVVKRVGASETPVGFQQSGIDFGFDWEKTLGVLLQRSLHISNSNLVTSVRLQQWIASNICATLICGLWWRRHICSGGISTHKVQRNVE